MFSVKNYPRVDATVKINFVFEQKWPLCDYDWQGPDFIGPEPKKMRPN
jgi:hypothetical protein